MPSLKMPLVCCFCLLLTVALANCNDKQGELLKVAAEQMPSPHDSSYSFYVYYKASSSPFDRGYSIKCSVPDINGVATPFEEIPINENGLTILEKPLQKPGAYTVSCTDGETKKESSFTMQAVAGLTQPIQPESETSSSGQAATGQAEAPAAPFEKPKYGDFTSGSLRMSRDQATTSQQGFVPAYCLPGADPKQGGGSADFSIGPDGALAGTCEDKNLTTGTLTGQWSDNGDVTFTLEIRQEVRWANPNTGQIIGTAIYNTVWSSTSGAFTSGTVASGVAEWHATCKADGINSQCYPDASAKTGTYNGTIPWTITFSR